MNRSFVFAIICASLATFTPVRATTFYASPTGTHSASGTLASPWDLRTALNSSLIQPGDTVYLRGGVYYGKYNTPLTGTAASPITIRSYPGEWARLDGYAPVTPTATIGSTDTSIPLSAATQAVPAANMLIDQEMIYVKGAIGNVASVIRGWSGTTPTTHSPGAIVKFAGPMITVSGGYVWLQNLEVMSSDPIRQTLIAGSFPIDIQRGTGINVTAPNVKLINLVIHDAGDAIGFPTYATDCEIAGEIGRASC